MKKKKPEPDKAARAAFGEFLVARMVQAFTDAYQARMAGATLEEIMIGVDIEAAYHGDPSIKLAVTRATRSAVNAVNARVPLNAALQELAAQLSERLQKLIEK